MRAARVAVALLALSGLGALGIVACGSFTADDPAAGDEAGSDDAGMTSDRALGDGVRPVGDGGVDACIGLTLQTDDSNCGACGHSCLGGKCMAGACLPFELTKQTENIVALAPTPSFVYLIAAGANAVRVCPFAGCPTPTTIADSLSGPFAIVPFGDDALLAEDNGIDYVTTGNKSRIASFIAVRALVTDTTSTGYFIAADPGVFLYELHPRDGGTYNKLGAQADSLLALAFANGQLYEYESSGTELFRTCSPPACDPDRALVATSAGAATHIALAAAKDGLYWARTDFGKIQSCAAAGCTVPSDIPPGVDADKVNAIAADDQSIYYSTGTEGGIYRCPHAGCGLARVTLVTGMLNPHALYVTKDALYWATDGDNMTRAAGVWRLAK